MKPAPEIEGRAGQGQSALIGVVDLPLRFSQPLPDQLLDRVAHRLAVLGQPVRIRMLVQLAAVGEVSVQVLADAVGATQQNVSRHLALLRADGLVEARPNGRQVLYRLVDPRTLAVLNEVGWDVVNRLRGPAGDDLESEGDVVVTR